MMLLELTAILPWLMGLISLFVVHTLKKTDTKIDETSRALHAYKLENTVTVANIRSETIRDFATKLELQATEYRMVSLTKDVHIKLDRLIEHLINRPASEQ